MEGKKDMVSMVQGMMQGMTGQDSGYVESLDEPTKNRVTVLKTIQNRYNEAEQKFLAELRELELKYDSIYKPIMSERAEIVTGKKDVPANDGKEIKTKGVPEFWFTALCNVNVIQPIIEEYDEPILRKMTDMRCDLLPDNLGFKLSFDFDDNEYFTNKTLEKTYFLQDDKENGDQVFHHSTGCTIDWKPEKNVTVEVIKKTQKKKGTKQKRVVTSTVERPSFFNFFSPPQIPDEGTMMEEQDIEELEMKMSEDYQVGSVLKEKVIPRAVLYFTGEAMQDDEDDFDGEEDEDDEDGEGEEDQEPEDDEDDDEGGDAPAAAPAKGQKPEECKQQ